MDTKQKALNLITELEATLSIGRTAGTPKTEVEELLEQLSAFVRATLEPVPFDRAKCAESGPQFGIGFLSSDGEVVGSHGGTASAAEEPVWGGVAAALDFRAALKTLPSFGTARAHFKPNGKLTGFTIDLND